MLKAITTCFAFISTSAWALYNAGGPVVLLNKNNWKEEELFSYLDLVAVSIGADIVPITGENRVLCYHGMLRLNASPRLAFQELVLIAKRQFPVTLTDVVFIIAPRINAAPGIWRGSLLYPRPSSCHPAPCCGWLFQRLTVYH